MVLRIDRNSIKCYKLSNCFIGTDHHRGGETREQAVANGKLIGTASNWRTVGCSCVSTKGTCVQSDGLLVAIKSGSLLLEKWKPTSAGGSLGFRLIHGIYSTGGVLMCDLPIRCGQIVYRKYRKDKFNKSARNPRDSKAEKRWTLDSIRNLDIGNRSSPQRSGHSDKPWEYRVIGGMWLECNTITALLHLFIITPGSVRFVAAMLQFIIPWVTVTRD